MNTREFTVNARKFDRTIHRTWFATLVERSDSQIEFAGVFREEVVHPYLGVIRPGTISCEYYWLDRWYSIFRFHEPDGALRNFYCNINMPPTIEGNVLDFIDLDIDILVWPDLTHEILDKAEFEENTSRYPYPATIVAKAEKGLEQVLSMIAEREFPFDRTGDARLPWTIPQFT